MVSRMDPYARPAALAPEVKTPVQDRLNFFLERGLLEPQTWEDRLSPEPGIPPQKVSKLLPSKEASEMAEMIRKNLSREPQQVAENLYVDSGGYVHPRKYFDWTIDESEVRVAQSRANLPPNNWRVVIELTERVIRMLEMYQIKPK